MNEPVPIKIQAVSIALLFLLGGLLIIQQANAEEGVVNDVLNTGPAPTRSPTWSDPPLKRIQGDDFSERAIFVHQDDSTYLDDMLFCAAVPAAVHWEGDTRYDSMIISDDTIRENGNLIGDYSEYLRKIGATPDIDLIGPVDGERQAVLESYFTDVDQVNTVTISDNVYEGASDIARYYWKNRRDLGTDTAVISYVPDFNGGTEVRKNTRDTRMGTFNRGYDINADETPWIRFTIDWEDPGADTDYRIGVQDPYALHMSSYTNQGEEGHVNPTDNKLFDHEGYGEIGMAPYYSYMPYSLDDAPQDHTYRQFTGTLPGGDGSIWPLPNGTDHQTFQFGPVKKGEWIGVVTNWTHYDVNETIYRDFNTYIYNPDQEVGPEYHLEVATNDYTYENSNRNTPESGYCYADRDGYYSVTVHPFVGSVGGTFHTIAYWGGLDEASTWNAGQTYPGNDFADYDLLEYQYLPDEVSESVTNGAVVASLNHVPLLYTAGGTPEPVVLEALEEIGVENVILIDPGNRIDGSKWAGAGMGVTHISNDVDVFNYIYEISKERGLDKSLVLPAQGGPWFSGAALAGAYHGSPAPALDDDEVKWAQVQSTAMWWQVIQDSTVYQKAPQNRYSNPSQANMERLSDDIFSWLEGFNADFNPDCGDSDGDGAPDNGVNWDYSEDVDVLVISPMNAVKPVFDRAMSGKASVGRITPAEPEVLWAVLNREMLYWKVGFSQASNPENPDDSLPVDDHWMRALWTFNTYAHDDDIVDYDAGDQDDDDYCGVDDGGANHLQYKTREDLPSYAEGSGRISEFDTYYDDILESLEEGTILWSNHGHGHAYWMLETGPGFTGTSVDPSNPKWGLPVPDNGFVDPPLETTSGWDWYYGLDNVHSSFSTYQSCQVGGSALSEYYLRLGGIGVIGGYVTRSLVEATIQSDRTTKGLFMYNMTFGEAHRWGQDETGSIYSLDDPGVSNRNYQEYGYPDDVDKRYGDTGHTILYGDPGLRILAPTLFTSAGIYVDERGENLIVDLSVMDQSGVSIDPDSITISIDGEEVASGKMATGRYSASMGLDNMGPDLEVMVSVKDDEYLSPFGDHEFSRNYDVHLTEGGSSFGDISYTGGLKQIVSSSGPTIIPAYLEGEVTPEMVNFLRLEVKDHQGGMTNVSIDLFHDGAGWIMEDMNVSTLPGGIYSIDLLMSIKHVRITSLSGPTIVIQHELYFEEGSATIDEYYKVLRYEGLVIRSTYEPHHTVTENELGLGRYQLQIFDGTEFVTIDEKGDIQYVAESGTFRIDHDMCRLAVGTYRAIVTASVEYTGLATFTSSPVDLDVPPSLSDPTIRYVGGMTQMVLVDDIIFYQTSENDKWLDQNQVMEATCKVLFSDLHETGISVPIVFVREWGPLEINVSSLKNGRYYLKIEVMTRDYGNNFSLSGPIDIEHMMVISGPEVIYDNIEYTLDILDILVTPSCSDAEVFPTSICLKRYGDDEFSEDITHLIRFAGDVWYLRDLDVRSLLPGGDDYFLELAFMSDGIVAISESGEFTISYDLVISPPAVVFDLEHDILRISGISVMSAYNTDRFLSPEELSEKMVRLYNSSTGELLDEFDLFSTDALFYRDIPTAAERYGEGVIFIEVIFSTPFSGEYSLRSDPIQLTLHQDTEDEDDDVISEGGEEGTSGSLLAAVVLGLLIALVCLVSLAMIYRKRRGSSIGAAGAEISREPVLGHPPAPPIISGNLSAEGMNGQLSLKEGGRDPLLHGRPEVEYLRPVKPNP